MTTSATAVVIADRPQLKFVATIQGMVDLNDGDEGPVMTKDQLFENLSESLSRIVSNGGITGDTPGEVDVYQTQVQVLETGGDSCDELILDQAARQEAELAAAVGWREKAVGLISRNEQVESMLFNLVHCWRLGESVDVLMRNAELLLQPEASHWNGEPSQISLGADDELHCVGHHLSLRSLETGASFEHSPDIKVAPWVARSEHGSPIEVSFQEAYAIGELSTATTGDENINITLGKLICDELAFTGSELILSCAGVAPTHIPMVGGYFRFGGVAFLDMFASPKR